MTRPAADDADRLLALLRRLGATDAELASLPASERGQFALELALRDGEPPVPIEEVARILDGPVEDVSRFLQALGFPASATSVPAALVEPQRVLAREATALLGEEAALALARVIGASATRIAEAVVDAFRVGVELPQLAAGTPYSDIVDSYVAITREALPALERMVVAVLRSQLVRTAASAWAPDADGTATRRDLAVGFVDLVGYTALARTSGSADLATMLRRFVDTATDVLGRHGARVIKELGDGLMFTAENAGSGAAAAVAMAAAFPIRDVVPPVRVGLACGTVLTQFGDYFGDVVNLAARLVALARPGTVVVSGDVATALDPQWRLERLPDQALKGFGAPSVVYRLIGPDQEK